ncbi:uncharacterized protein PB18E9.04c-like isoform X1 [Rhagoletis pomonella]|uniref:uncharacterized protein PB18E9.04c-like isoform X1 n=1 Tax=Rhagoletis pomonella TaxID=28610 RepID=UPI00177C4866|nr:uncharacterized protein PB18E9.04c-like isoform X1 [Rhagoletis pomonella]XP_036341283.1 uncharacterized protein PB18E9.04c-like isoform X1 [Rhagoletis pomonella]XP_036341284.1 uncharacterized protein PB18E9.04c-like isoform X1 [Rhagoletis pomonella]XP_036341292.1 uncharacterized protein PB18E9.04c-like isoform X1 [Rhagoletis pomonella]XP_036341293.1 uncharacterized protein PB18E9.04c-like isoform X1 [Rhagoletis pomonella]XP_036341294.1 uncharacterized protein PB18E9.04c-like isoform X1 [Rha
MFSFHKPRVYRSAEGCCICRAKSSSSRFTDSRKYEQDSMKCFDLKYPRHGEICNACVLLVKRFKRLPIGSTRHWGHVVDARAGPGTKSISKHKKSRDDAENTSNNTISNNTNSRRTHSSKSLIPEKFSKIFKKSKKNKLNVVVPNTDKKTGTRRTSITSLKTWGDQNSLSHTPDSVDSDYEDIGEGGEACEVSQIGNSSTVQFQTQTRASSYRACRKRTSSGNTSINIISFRRSLKIGSKRRKCMPPMRNRSTMKIFNDKMQFFDESEWQERKSCCGMVYVCPELTGTILIDMENFKACPEHQRPRGVDVAGSKTAKEQQPVAPQKTIIATLPAVVQISAPSVASVCLPPLPTAVPVLNPNPTPVLKKHHLFFKRQSECFPQVDLPVNNNIVISSNKTESLAAITTTPVIIKSSTNITNHKTTIPTIPHTSAINNANNPSTSVSTPLALAVNTTNMPAISSISPSSSTPMSGQMPRHSTAKVTTISPPLPAATNMASGNRLLHKIKSGKIFKQSLDKIGVMTSAGAVSPSAVERIKAGDLQELKPVIRNVPKSYVITKPTSGAGQQCTQYYPPVGSSLTSTCSNSSVISSTLSSAAPKFSDNSSDSGFDENLQDRKSASPLQEDTEKKLAARAPMGNVHTMFLASGVQIHGQHQNLMLTGNEVAAKLLQNRKQQMSMMATSNSSIMHHYQQHSSNNAAARLGTTTTSLKISQVSPSSISTISVGSTVSSNLGSHIKTTTTTTLPSRTIYNSNTIQHENGVTTIVPASSLAASSQTAAMNALAPSTVTITPAPTHHLGGVGAVTSATVSLTKKIATSSVGVNLIATSSNNPNNMLHTVPNSAAHHLISHNNALLQQHHQQQMQQHHNTTTNMNQKIILLKTTGHTKYNNLGSVGGNSNGNIIKPSGAATINASTANAGICKN